MTDYQVAIPSSSRAQTLVEKTLPLLLAGGIPTDRITVHVPDADQQRAYTATLAGTGVRIVNGHGPGVRAARNAIASGYPPGTQLVEVDDDITGFFRCTPEKQLTPLTNLDGFIRDAFATAGTHLWCVYPVANAFFMDPERVRRGGLWYAIGCFFGYVVNGSIARELVRCDDKEDFERSCRFYEADGEIVRFDSATFTSRFYKEPGGMQDYRTPDTIREGAQRLAHMYPHLATAYVAKSGHWEVRLRDRRPQLTGTARRKRSA